MRRTWRCVAVASCLGLVAAACGGDDDDSSDATEPPGATEVPAATDASVATDAPSETEGTEAPDGTGGTTETASEETSEPAETGDTVDPASIEFDLGVDETTIKVGMLADLSGIFAPIVRDVVAAQEVYWDDVNANGGIGGRQVELVIEDNAYDVAQNVEKYAIVREDVAMLSQVTGSPHTAAIAQDMVDDDLIGIPLTWYSGWADPEIGQNVFETYTSYCIESMNAIQWIHDNRDVQTVAIASFPGEFGGDGAAGAKLAAEQLGLEVVYDGTGQVTPPSADNPNPDQSAVVSQIVASNADLVWAVVNPGALSAIMSQSVGQGFTGLWSGNYPTFSFRLLGTELAPLLDQYFIVSSYVVSWGTDVPGMQDVVDKMATARPELPVSDAYIFGWTEAQVTQAVLEQASANGDMTRAGIVAAANEVTVDFDGLAPTQTWAGEPNDYIVRESYLYDVSLDLYNPVTLGEGEGNTGTELLEGPYTSQLAEDYVFEGACYTG